MRNKKLFAILAAGGLWGAALPLAAHAHTLGIASEEGVSTYRYYAAPEEEDAERQLRAEKQQFKESLAWLEKYGVTYDLEEDAILYQGKTVRYLIDEQRELGGSAIYSMPEGQVDVYTIRDETGAAVGVREATEEEYSQNSDLISGAVGSFADEVAVAIDEGEEAALEGSYLFSCGGEEVSVETESADGISESPKQDDLKSFYIAEENGGSLRSTDVYEEEIREQCSEGISYIPSAEELAQERKREEEYAAIGITKDDNGGWLWEGKSVYFLLDEDGSIHMNSTAKTNEERIYLFVSRDGEGTALKAEAVGGKELLEKKAELDERLTE